MLTVWVIVGIELVERLNRVKDCYFGRQAKSPYATGHNEMTPWPVVRS